MGDTRASSKLILCKSRFLGTSLPTKQDDDTDDTDLREFNLQSGFKIVTSRG